MVKITFLIFFLFIFFGLFFKYRKDHLISLLKDLRYLRIGHYLLFGLLGISLRPGNISFSEIDLQLVLMVVFSILSIIFGIIFSIITNNIFDADIDRISNPNRPLIQGIIGNKEYKNYAYIFLCLSLLFAGFVNFSIFILVFLFIGAYFVYSIPPFRIKRIPIISKWVIGLNSLILLNIGRLLFYPNNPLPFFPSILLVGGIGLIANFIDLKDFEGDKAGKILTLPTILGKKRSKRLIGLFFLIIYPASIFLLYPYFSLTILLSILLPFMVLIAFLQYLLINRKKYSEIPIFLLNNFSILFIGVFLFKFAQ